jgi:hypothetical protein
MPQTYTEIIADLKLARDKLVEALATGGAGAIQEWEIRGRRLRFRDLTTELLKIEKLIRYYEGLTNNEQGRQARTRARLKYN